MNLLVTGGAGFIGTNFLYYWVRHHPEDRLIVLDALTYAGNRGNLISLEESTNFKFVHGDIKDDHLVEELLGREKIETIVNFAAESHVDRSILGPDPFIETNVLGTHTLLKIAKKVWLDKTERTSLTNKHLFHQISTDEVYGSLHREDPPFTEETSYKPNSPYAASKAAADHLVRAYYHTYGLPVTISNCSNNYGPFQYPEKLIPVMLSSILSGKSLPVYGDGQNIRDWLYVEDHCRGIECILKKGKVGETYNIGGQNEWTNIELVRLLCKLVNELFENNTELREKFPSSPPACKKPSEELIAYVQDRKGHDLRYAINAQKISSQLGFKPKKSFEQGLRETICWYLENDHYLIIS